MGFRIDPKSDLGKALAATLGKAPADLAKASGGNGKLDMDKLREAFPDRFIFIGEKHASACWEAWAVDNGDAKIGDGDLLLEWRLSCQYKQKPDQNHPGFTALFGDVPVQCLKPAERKGSAAEVEALAKNLKGLEGRSWSEAASDDAALHARWEDACSGRVLEGI